MACFPAVMGVKHLYKHETRAAGDIFVVVAQGTVKEDILRMKMTRKSLKDGKHEPVSFNRNDCH
jgi:UDP-glucose 4-epimerase